MMRLTREFFVLKARLPLIVVVLVVIPTAILSIIAARSLKADELIEREPDYTRMIGYESLRVRFTKRESS